MASELVVPVEEDGVADTADVIDVANVAEVVEVADTNFDIGAGIGAGVGAKPAEES